MQLPVNHSPWENSLYVSFWDYWKSLEQEKDYGGHHAISNVKCNHAENTSVKCDDALLYKGASFLGPFKIDTGVKPGFKYEPYKYFFLI